jgi:hypothetical protein
MFDDPRQGGWLGTGVDIEIKRTVALQRANSKDEFWGSFRTNCARPHEHLDTARSCCGRGRR